MIFLYPEWCLSFSVSFINSSKRFQKIFYLGKCGPLWMTNKAWWSKFITLTTGMDVKQDKRKRFFDIFYAVELFLQTLTKLPIKSSYKIDDLIQQSFCKGVAIVYPSLVSCGPTFDSQVHASFMIYFFFN